MQHIPEKLQKRWKRKRRGVGWGEELNRIEGESYRSAIQEETSRRQRGSCGEDIPDAKISQAITERPEMPTPVDPACADRKEMAEIMLARPNSQEKEEAIAQPGKTPIGHERRYKYIHCKEYFPIHQKKYQLHHRRKERRQTPREELFVATHPDCRKGFKTRTLLKSHQQYVWPETINHGGGCKTRTEKAARSRTDQGGCRRWKGGSVEAPDAEQSKETREDRQITGSARSARKGRARTLPGEKGKPRIHKA